jgi:hypothetical protein
VLLLLLLLQLLPLLMTEKWVLFVCVGNGAANRARALPP